MVDLLTSPRITESYPWIARIMMGLCKIASSTHYPRHQNCHRSRSRIARDTGVLIDQISFSVADT